MIFILNNAQERFVHIVPSSFQFEKKIWLYWEDTNIPQSVRLCLDALYTFHPSDQIHFLNKKNVHRWVHCKETSNLLNDKNISTNHKSDLLRLYIMYNYGGLYIDSSVCTFESFDWAFNLLNSGNEILMYKNNNFSNQDANAYESWFICTYEANPIIKQWYLLMLSILKGNLSEMYNNMKKMNKMQQHPFIRRHTSYHIIYAIFIYTQIKQPNIKNKIYDLDCDVDAYPCMLMYNRERVSDLFLKKITVQEYTNIKKYKLVKYTRYNRAEIDDGEYKINANSFYHHLLKMKL